MSILIFGQIHFHILTTDLKAIELFINNTCDITFYNILKNIVFKLHINDKTTKMNDVAVRRPNILLHLYSEYSL